jgi:hypothetical protein
MSQRSFNSSSPKGAGSRRIHVGGAQPADLAGAPAAIKIDLSGPVARPVVVEPGEYELVIKLARIVPPKPIKNASVALGLYAIDQDGGETRVRTRPYWLWSREHPADDQPDLVLHNRALLGDILRAAGKQAPGDLAGLVEALKGVEFIAYLTVRTDRVTGEHLNEVEEVLLPEPEEGA